jgi:hypothetical protein
VIERVEKLLNKKHLLILGKSESERKTFINKIVETTDFAVFRFPKGMKSIYDYLDFTKKEKLHKAWYQTKGNFNTNQILDFHWDWITENDNSLIIMEEFDSMEETWKIELLRIYLNEIENRKKGEKKIHLILSQENENGLIEKIAKVIDKRDNERRTEVQIVEQNLEKINI